MGQYWDVICLDKREATGFIGKLGEALYNSAPETIEKLLTRYEFNLAPLPVKPFDKPKTLSTLEQLPLELIERILLFVPRSATIFCFSLTCYRFLEIGRHIIARNKKKYTTPWAGKRIICVGDYVEDYPDNVLTEKEKAIMSDKNLYDYARDLPGPAVFNRKYIDGIIDAVNRKRYFMSKYLILSKWIPKLHPVCTDKSKLVLLNITTNEYVRQSKILPEYGVRFGHIILLHACWSSDSSTAVHCEEEFHRGPWAGHRFEITSIDYVNDNATDVSNDIVPRILSIMDQDKTANDIPRDYKFSWGRVMQRIGIGGSEIL